MKFDIHKVFSSGKRAKFAKASIDADSFELAWDLFKQSPNYNDKYQYHLIDEQGNVELFPGHLISKTIKLTEDVV